MNVKKRHGGTYTDELLIITDRVFIGNLRLFYKIPTNDVKNNSLIYFILIITNEYSINKIKFLFLFMKILCH